MKLLGCLLLLFAVQIQPISAAANDGAANTIAAARQAAHDNRNAAAAKLFEQAVAEAPDRRVELLPELADQLTYSGQAARAVALYRESLVPTMSADERRRVELGLALALSWSKQLSQSLRSYDDVLGRQPHDLDALLGQARVLSWQNQLSKSLSVYGEVLAIDPGNLDARRNVIRVQNWRGRQRYAKRLANEFLVAHPGDADVSLDLARANLWMGRPDEAARVNRTILDANAMDSSARSFSRDIADAGKTQFNASESVGTQSDNLIIRTGNFEADARSDRGLGSYGVRYQPISYTGQNDAGDAVERRLGFVGRQRLADWSEINASASNDEITSVGSPVRNILLYDTYLTLWPNDTLRFDVGSHKETFDNLTSLRLGITGNFETASVDITPDENDRLTLRANVASFTDGNRRGFEQIEYERAVLHQPHLSFGGRGTSYSFKNTTGDGYFAPPHYQSAELTTHLFGNVRSRFYYDGSASLGREWVVDNGNRPTHSLNATLSYVISHPLSISTFVNSFNTRQQISNSGFARTTVGVRLQSSL